MGLAAAVLVVLLAAGAAMLFVARDAARPEGLKAGAFDPVHAAPEFALRGSDGSKVTLARYRGTSCGAKYAEALWAMHARPTQIF